MPSLTFLTPEFAVAPQLVEEDLAHLAAVGIRTVIAVRPDHEDPDSPMARDIGRVARASGLTFRYAPASSLDVLEPETVERFETALGGVSGPVVAYCKSGTRAAIIWALAAARYQSATCVGEALRKAGVDPELIEDQLKEQQHKPSASRPAPLTVECPKAQGGQGPRGLPPAAITRDSAG